jgi:hypothetical protein
LKDGALLVEAYMLDVFIPDPIAPVPDLAFLPDLIGACFVNPAYPYCN